MSIRPTQTDLQTVNPNWREQIQDEAHDTTKARREWSRRWGIKVSQRAYPCPTRWLTRRRCPGEGCCWFADGTYPSALDHVRGITRLSDGQRGLLTMPYGLGDDDADDLAHWCRDHGLGYLVLGDGWHFPGTVAIVMFPREDHRP